VWRSVKASENGYNSRLETDGEVGEARSLTLWIRGDPIKLWVKYSTSISSQKILYLGVNLVYAVAELFSNDFW
jgi:hypothetical protein